MKVAIIVLNYNGADCLLKCLRSLSELRYEDKEIIVADNGSTDDSFLVAKKGFPSFVFVANGENKGFAGGMNIGMREAFARGADSVWLFNSDASSENDTLDFLVAAAKRYPDAGLFSPLIFEDGSEKIWFGAGRVDFLRMRTEHTTPPKRLLRQDAYESRFLTGCALFIRREVIEKIGFLDERFFLYYEDADFCWRARKAGFRCLVVPRAHVHHQEKSRKSNEKTFYLVYSGLLFFEKHSPWFIRPYGALYGTIRRIKNRMDRLLGRKEAAFVFRAYEKFYGRSSEHFSHLRQLS